MQDVTGYSEAIQEYLDGTFRGPTPPTTMAQERKMEEIFSQSDKVKAIEAVKHVVKVGLKEGLHGERKVRMGTKGISFAVQKEHRHMDGVDHGYVDAYDNIPWEVGARFYFEHPNICIKMDCPCDF